mmetsp:Transcript_7468/g.20363  ORF Transcript_7468/g.20363 Transcript_7468/m.20363 type:complete len:81 (-) Transcript_7468:191-433(-)
MQALRLLDEELDTNCAICFERLQNAQLERCGHSTFCLPCVKDLTICPLCREPIEGVTKVQSWSAGGKNSAGGSKKSSKRS